MPTHSRSNGLCADVEIPQTVQPDRQLRLGPFRSPPLIEVLRRRQSHRPVSRDEGTVVDQRAELRVDELVDFCDGRVEDDLGGSDDVQVQRDFAWLDLVPVGNPCSFRLDRGSSLLLDLSSGQQDHFLPSTPAPTLPLVSIIRGSDFSPTSAVGK
jgi:hypothetical protein